MVDDGQHAVTLANLRDGEELVPLTHVRNDDSSSPAW